MMISEQTEPRDTEESKTTQMPPWGPPVGEEPVPPWGAPPGNMLPPWEPPSGEGTLPPWGPPVGEEPVPPWGPPPGNMLPPWEPPSGEGTLPPWGPPPGNMLPPWGPPPGNLLPPIILPSNPPKGTCYVRFLYAAVDQPAVNISVEQQMRIRTFRYANVTPYYRETAGRGKVVRVTEAYSGKLLQQSRFAFQDGYSYTIALVNGRGGISLLLLVDSPCESVGNFACVRAVNLAATAEPMDVFLSGVGRAFRGVGRLEQTAARNIRAGTYRAFVSEALPCVSNAGIEIGDTYVECQNTQMAILDSTMFHVKRNVLYTLYLIGRPYQYPALQILPLDSDDVY